MQTAPVSFPHLYTIIGNNGRILHCPCTDSSYSILVFGQGSKLFLSGAFSFQVLYGCISVNGFLFTSSRFNSSNFTAVSIPQSHLPAFFSICNDLSSEVHIERIQSRLREFVNDSRMLLPFIEEFKPVAILLVKLEMDIVSHFVKQQSQSLSNISRLGVQLGPNLFCLNIAECDTENNANSIWTIQNFASMQILEDEYREVLRRIGKVLETQHSCVLQVVGNKGVGKSTMCRYLLNSLNSRSRSNKPEFCRVFMLDLDVGQSEFTPSGCLSLFETSKPLITSIFGAPFASLESSFANSYFFGSNDISVDFDLYLNLAAHLWQRFILYEKESKSAGHKCVLVVNTPGWIDGHGYDLMLQIIRLTRPNILACIDRPGNGINFEVPKHLQKITRRIRLDIDCPQLPLCNSALLRDFLVLGYFAQTFRQFKMKLPSSVAGNELRLSDTLSTYRVPFRSISIYLHPEILNIEDCFMLNAVNCSLVALCKVENGFEKNFERRPLLADNSLPSRLVLCPRRVGNEPCPNHSGDLHDDDNEIIEITNTLTDYDRNYPILRCIGFGFVRAINLERKLFYVITPVEQRNLGQVDVLALGYRLNTPELIFPMDPYAEAIPYLIELRQSKNTDERHKKLFSPLRVVTGTKRALQARLLRGRATSGHRNTHNGSNTRTLNIAARVKKRARLS